MATLSGVIADLVALLDAKLSTVLSDGNAVTVKVGEGYPAENVIQDVARRNTALVCVVDRMSVPARKHWWSRDVGEDITPPGIKSTLSKGVIPIGGTAALTLALADGSTAIKNEDAVSLVSVFDPVTNDAAVAMAVVPGETLTSLAAKLAAAINARAPLNTWISATSSGAVVTLTNVSSARTPRIDSYCGNVGKFYREVGRKTASVQIVIFAGTVAARNAVADIVEVELGRMQADSGFLLPDGQSVMLTMNGGLNDYSNTLRDVYRRDVMTELEYTLIAEEKVWSVLAPISTQNPLENE